MKSTTVTKKKQTTKKVVQPKVVKKGVKKGVPKPKLTTEKKAAKSAIAVSSPAQINSFTVVAIGASAGGLEAVTALLKNISPTTGMAFIYVQHLSPDHKSLLTSILSKVTAMKVQEIDDMEKMKPDNFYVIPHNKEIEVTDGHIKLIPRPKNKSSNLSIDVLFSSLAIARKENVIGVVLSGSASDGTRGLREIKQAGGMTFAQDDSAKFTSMPHSAIAEGVVDFVLSPKEIATELNWISTHHLINREAQKKEPENEIENSDPDLKNIIQLLNKQKNVDFSHYKMNTIKRRMLRRMLIHKIKTLKKYFEFLSKKNDELELLHADLLINVTEFFRDEDAFAILKKLVLPRLLKSKAPNETLRIWVAACASGEEVYSIAMLLRELQGNKPNQVPFQIFASDLSASAINVARIGEYTLAQTKNVSPKRLQQFFTKANGKYRISKSLRDVCVFAQHNILQAPPFSRMDLISCRNMLIYLDNAAQKKALTTFHYALNDCGYLMLGKSESIGTLNALFTDVNKKYKIFSRKKNSGTHKIPDINSRIPFSFVSKVNSIASKAPKKATTITALNTLGNAFDSFLLSNYLPASVIINYDLEILQFRGATDLYLKHHSGKASFNILTMARPEITFELRNAIHHAVKTKQTVIKSGIEMSIENDVNSIRIANIEVAPFFMEGEVPLLAIVFSGQTMDVIQKQGNGAKNNSIAKDRRIKKLEEELASARADMGSITHDQEAANEELQSANEEIVSSNEELQSLNEELETSKEEIESTNEELTTSNHELLARNQLVEDLYTYYEAILSTIQEPMLILEKDLRIKSANNAFHKFFRLTEEESIGISLFKLGHNHWNIPQLRELLEEILHKNILIHNFEVEHKFPSIGRKIMLLNANRFIQKSNNEELIVLTITDITQERNLATELKEKEKKALEKKLEIDQKALRLIEESNIRYNMMLMQSPFAFAILKGKDLKVHMANDSIKEMWGKGKSIEGKALFSFLPELKKGPIPALLMNVYKTGIPFHGYEVLAPLKRNGKLVDSYFNFVYQPYLEVDESISGVTIISYEVTEHVIVKNELQKAKTRAEAKSRIAEDALKAKQQFLSNMSHEIRTPMNGIIGFTNVVLKTKLNDTQREYISAIKTSGDALIVLINDILDLAKVDSGKMTFEHRPFNLALSISTMLQVFETKVNEKKLNLIKEYDKAIPDILYGDSLRLRQILLNLVSNAVKFTSSGNVIISVRIQSEVADKIYIEFTLEDTGIGIPEDRLEHIFNDFEQASSETASAYGGTGLGLAIVKQLVELQGGRISVKSKLGKGSIFNFVLPFIKEKLNIEQASETNLMTGHEAVPENKNIKILVAEDIPLNQLLMKTLLMDFGFDFDIADNGKLAIEKLQSNNYDLILMDLQMPVMNGFDATIFIRNEMHSQVPIIALTADVTSMDTEKCKVVGMNDYISKPIDEKLLYSKIIKYLKNTENS